VNHLPFSIPWRDIPIGNGWTWMDGDVLLPAKKQHKIVFFVQPGLDSFLKPVIADLSENYNTRLIMTSKLADIEKAMEWADVCWFEWCDSLIVYASKLPVSMQKKIICRLHSYEAFTSYLYDVNWSTVDRVIFVGEHIRSFVLEKVPQLREDQTVVIPNGVQIGRFTYRNRKPGFKIAYVGYINYKKGPMLLLHAFKAIHDRDSRYQLHIAGVYQDIRYRLYFAQMILEWGLLDSIHFDGWQSDVDAYLDDKDFVISTSPLESQHLSIMEAMAKGIKPLIHNFYGAKLVYGDSCLWNSIDDLVAMVLSNEYHSASYCDFIKQSYEYGDQMEKIRNLIGGLCCQPDCGPSHGHTREELPVVTVGIINYNYAQYLDTCIQSVLAQSYPKIEILVVDDCSTDDSRDRILGYVHAHENISAIFHPENTGTEAIAFKELFLNAHGTYLMWVSADDFLPHGEVVSNYMNCLLEDETLDYVYGDLTLVNHAGQITDSWIYRSYTPDEVVRSIFQRKGSGVIPMAGMYKLSFYRDNGYQWVMDKQNTNAGDTLNCLVNVRRGWKYQYLNKPGLAYRRHGKNLSFHVRKRIVSLISVMEYIVHNFSEIIYLPHFNWSGLTDVERNAQKDYAVGLTYWEMYQDYMSSSWVAGLGELEKMEFLQPLLDKVIQYFSKSLIACRTFEQQIENILSAKAFQMK
jgi:glycosyltransferase involved in cell wall biosynthesis